MSLPVVQMKLCNKINKWPILLIDHWVEALQGTQASHSGPSKAFLSSCKTSLLSSLSLSIHFLHACALMVMLVLHASSIYS